MALTTVLPTSFSRTCLCSSTRVLPPPGTTSLSRRLTMLTSTSSLPTLTTMASLCTSTTFLRMTSLSRSPSTPTSCTDRNSTPTPWTGFCGSTAGAIFLRAPVLEKVKVPVETSTMVTSELATLPVGLPGSPRRAIGTWMLVETVTVRVEEAPSLFPPTDPPLLSPAPPSLPLCPSLQSLLPLSPLPLWSLLRLFPSPALSPPLLLL